MRSHIIFLGSLLLSVTTSALSNTNCTSFNRTPNEVGYITSGASERISGSFSCPSTAHGPCPAYAKGDLLRDFYTNLSSSGLSWFFPPYASLATADLPFNDSVIGAIDTFQGIPKGTTGYLRFTPAMLCYTGTVSDCVAVGNTKSNITNGAAVEVCAPLWHRDSSKGISVLDGNVTVVQLNGSATSLSDPFANQARGDESAATLATGARGNTALLALVAVGVVSSLVL